MNKKIKLIVILSVVFVIVNIIAYMFISNNKEEKIQIALEKHIEKLQTNYNIIEHYQRLTALAAYESTIGIKKVIDIMSAANSATTKKQKDILRKQLYNTLIKKYNILKAKGIFQYQFVLPNNKSFLRMHKQSKFGDDLTNIRKDFAIVNKTLKPAFGFSPGKIAHGFRNVFPLFNKNKKHIGAMEISFSSDIIQKDLNTISRIHTHFIVKKSIYAKKIWKKGEFAKKYSQSTEYKDYLISVTKYHNINICTIDGQKNLTALKSIIDKNIKKGEKFTLYQKYENNVRVISFLPIKNTEKTKTVAWFVSYEKDNYINDTLKFSFILNVIITFVLLLIFYFIYKVLNQKEMLDVQVKEKTKELKKQIEIAQNASKAKSEFLANMSHEIRTPLNAVMGFIDLLKDESVNRVKSLKYLNIIENSSKDLLMIIEDILDFSKIESGKLQIDKIDFNTRSEFEVITHLFQAKCSQKNISLSLNIDKNMPKFLNSDPLRIKQVISNLISNAIKFTSEGKNIIVTISYNDNKLFVSVKDEGIGINKNKLEHIFNAFSQEDSSTTRKYGGTGLGLTIGSELVKLLGGELKVESEVGVGSEFYFYIPVEIGKKLEVKNSDSKELNFSDKKILLVEDNKANQAFMKIVLKKMKLEFEIANDGVEAIDKFKANKYNAILMDENMPNMGGIEATKLILLHEKKNNLPHTPIIALTANALKGDRERFLEAGMDEYLTKPLNKEKLNEVLGKIL